MKNIENTKITNLTNKKIKEHRILIRWRDMYRLKHFCIFFYLRQ